MPDGKSVFKVYYVSIINRPQPELFEWEKCQLSQVDFEKAFVSGGYEGIGFLIAFPHITKVYRFSPLMETVLDFSERNTPKMDFRNNDRGDGFREFACYAEAILAADEYAAWARAATVEEYLAVRSSQTEFPVARNDKLAKYWV
jgi:hypothetical protein